MKKVLFVIAMEKEAKDIAKKLELNEIKNDKHNNYNSKIYRKDNISLLITGIGKQQSMRLIRHLPVPVSRHC